MKNQCWGILIGVLVGFPAIVLAAAPAGVGIAKGVVTIGGKPTSEAVVSVEGVPADQAKTQMANAKAKKAVMDQRNMKFVPTVLAILVGTKVDFPNNDNSWHNVYSKGGAKDFDLGLYPPGKSRDVTFDKSGVARILCNAHPNMEAFIVVKEQPFFSATDKRANFRINNIPLGKYRVTAWHPQLGVTEAGFELVRDGEVLDVSFDLKKK